jgi:protein-L-isoaspartate(D-aspartate) O-methyltransferase
MNWKDYRIARERMVKEQLYERGIRDGRVLDAMLKVPRHVFLDREAGAEAYNDHSFPIGFSQTMTQPFMVAYLAEQLKLTGSERVLEIGTGSGYQAAVLAMLAKTVYTVERVPELVERARRCLRELLFTNVTVLHGDGSNGWIGHSPFDRIVLTAAAQTVPRKLLLQLNDGGIFVGPAEKADGTQEIIRLTRHESSFEVERLRSCTFVRLARNGASDRRAPGFPQDGSGGR